MPHEADVIAPKVSVGLPVFNGDRYLEAALECIVSQTYGDFEVIISDNASHDRTEEICRTYAAQYPVIRYRRNESNIGGFRNNNRVIDLATGKYFLLTGHDDLRDPDQLSRCVEILEQNAQYVLCYTATTYIDEADRKLDDREVLLNTGSESAQVRFRELIRDDHKVEPVYGLICRRTLNDIRFGQFADSDRVFVAELGLRGPFYRIPERLFFRREHALKSTTVYQSRYDRAAWFNPGRKGRFVFPYMRQWREYLAAISRSPLGSRTKLGCYTEIARWTRQHRSKLARDLEYNVKQVLRPWVYRLRELRSALDADK